MQLISVSFILFCGSAVAVNGVDEEKKTSAITEWTLVFADESGSRDQLQNSNGVLQVKAVSQEQTSRNLTLKNHLFNALKDAHDIAMVKESTEMSGAIQIHPVDFAYGIYFKSLRVELIDSNGKTVGRLTVQNGGQNTLTKNDRSFARSAAKTIADALTKY